MKHSNLDALVKWLFDILASALGLLVLSPFFGIVAWGIKRDSPGPAFYRGRRAGRHGKEFHILKFRSMYEYPVGHERPESYQGAKVTAQGDPRVRSAGRWLREINLPTHPFYSADQVLFFSPHGQKPRISEEYETGDV